MVDMRDIDFYLGGMDQTRKRRSLFGLMGETREVLRDLVVAQPRALWKEVREKVRDLPKTNFDLGCMFAEQGKWTDAMFRFRIVLYLQPNYPNAHYNLGCCYYRMGKLHQAVVTLKRALQLNPAHTEALFMLAAIDPASVPPAQRPQRMPREMIVPFFTSLAERYDGMEAQNQYKGGLLVFDVLRPLVKATEITLVDMGCGTGLAARPWLGHARRIVGVDVTPAMVTIARSMTKDGRSLFDAVIEADMTAPASALADLAADAVLIVNVAQFVGALEGMMATAASLLKPGGLVAITVEPFAGAGFGLDAKTGRFGHSSAYVKQMAGAAGLVPVQESRVALYPNTAADLMIFSKGAA